jgi:AraC family transcriptional activator of pobA
MDKPEKIKDLCKKKIDWIPENIGKDIGHFNVFRLEPYSVGRARPVSYIPRDYYKITLVIGDSKIHYSDKGTEVHKQYLIFSNPWIPFKSLYSVTILRGYNCIFSPDFFHQYENFNQYEVFQPDGMHVFDLSQEQVIRLAGYYERMFEEINSDYIYKYDVLRNLVFEVLHFAIKMEHPGQDVEYAVNSS